MMPPGIYSEVTPNETFRGTVGQLDLLIFGLVLALAWENGRASIGLLQVAEYGKIRRAAIGLFNVAKVKRMLGIATRRGVRRSHICSEMMRGFKTALCSLSLMAPLIHR